MPLNNNGVTILANNTTRGVGDPNPQYTSLAGVYKKNRACLNGERYVKDIDSVVGINNILIPFSPSMDQGQYTWYQSEAEWPGITEQYARTLIGGLLRKDPAIEINEDSELNQEQREEALDWLRHEFSRDNNSIQSFLDKALWEEMITSNAWVYVNYPVTTPTDTFKDGELQPYPVLLAGESIINWATDINKATNRTDISRVVVRAFREKQSTTNQYHVDYVDTVWVHQLDDAGYYEIIVYEKSVEESGTTPVIAGKIQQDYPTAGNDAGWTEVDRDVSVTKNGERLQFIPLYPFNGEVEPTDPMLTNFINREIGLYNTMSRRNHLLYGSAAYTPVISAENMGEEEQQKIVDQGLGSWMFLGPNDTATILAAPTAALADLDRAIAARIEDMARMGIRILSPEGLGESGVALEIRNSAQTAQLASLNHRVSTQMRNIMITMLNWRYNTELTYKDVKFELSSDFTPVPLGESWLRLVTEWMQEGLIPKSVFLTIAKANDIIPEDYNEDDAEQEIEADPMVISERERFDMANQQTEAKNNLG